MSATALQTANALVPTQRPAQCQPGKLPLSIRAPRTLPGLHVASTKLHCNNVAASRVAVKEAELKTSTEDEEEEEEEEKSAFKATESGPEPPNAFEVQSLLMEICDETDIAEVKIKVGSFLLHVKRGQGALMRSPAPTVNAPPVPSFPMAEALASSGAAPAAPPPSPAAPAKDEDEGLLYITAPAVGILRLGRIYKGKRGRNLVAEETTIKKGQVVCYIEQLGTQLTVESEHAGDVVKFLADDGDAVGFGDPLIAVRPSFPGIKKLA